MIEIKERERDYTKPVLLVKVVFSIFILMVVILVFFYFNSRSEQAVNSVSQADIGQMTREQQLEELNRRSKTILPVVASKREISSKDLPLEILNMFGSNAQYVSVYLNAYNTGVEGFDLELLYPKSAPDAYFSILRSFRNEKWALLYGSRYEESGILNMENGFYTITITFEKIDDNNTKIKSLIVNKK